MKIRIVTALCLVLLGAGGAFAGPYPLHTWELAPEVYHFTYKEPNVMKDTGMMYGITGSYAYHNNVMLKIEGRGAWGKVDYSSEDSGSTDNISDFTFEARLLAGYDIPLSSFSVLTPYIGFGYRYLYDDFGGHTTTAGRAGYDRASNYYYSPVGIMSLHSLGKGWSIGATAEYDVFWRGRQKSYMSDVPGYDNITNDQNRGYGARGSLLVQKSGKDFSILFEPFIRYWNISTSDATTDRAGRVWYEPDNNTTEAGARIGIRF